MQLSFESDREPAQTAAAGLCRPVAIPSVPHGGAFVETLPLRVILSAESHRALLTSVPDTSRAWGSVIDAIEMPGTNTVPSAWMVTCDLESAMTLLTVATRDCPEAVQPIVDAVNRSL
jgi:hypothetical protein